MLEIRSNRARADDRTVAVEKLTPSKASELKVGDEPRETARDEGMEVGNDDPFSPSSINTRTNFRTSSKLKSFFPKKTTVFPSERDSIFICGSLRFSGVFPSGMNAFLLFDLRIYSFQFPICFRTGLFCVFRKYIKM